MFYNIYTLLTDFCQQKSETKTES